MVNVFMGWGWKTPFRVAMPMRARGYNCGATRERRITDSVSGPPTSVCALACLLVLIAASVACALVELSGYAFYPTMKAIGPWWICAVCPVHAVPGCLICLGLVALEVVSMNPQNRFRFDSAADATEESPVPAAQVSGYSFAYPSEEGDCRESRAVLNNVSLSVEQGAFCVLVGATGSGKTTLLRSLKPELAPVGESSGDIFVLGRALKPHKASCAAGHQADQPVDPAASSITPLESAQLIGYVMQDPAAQIVCDTVWHELAFGLENLGVEPDQMRRRIAEVAHFFGIEPWIRSKTEDLSGGQKQLVNLAAVLALRPRVLLLDEPTAQLDPNAVKQFLFMLSRVNRELGITVVMATHSPEDLRPYATQRIDLTLLARLARSSAQKPRCLRISIADALSSPMLVWP
ncbi:MAG: ABC transporter ATP-binding protein [Senegalimassilia faecalis]